MSCPDCGSTMTKKLSVRDSRWKCGHDECFNCGSIHPWIRIFQAFHSEDPELTLAQEAAYWAWFEECADQNIKRRYEEFQCRQSATLRT